MNMILNVFAGFGILCALVILLAICFVGWRTYRFYRIEPQFRLWLWNEFPRIKRFMIWWKLSPVSVGGLLFIIATLSLLLIGLIVTSPIV